MDSRHKKILVFVSVIFLCLGLFFGFLVSYIIHRNLKVESLVPERLNDKKYTFVNPLLECDKVNFTETGLSSLNNTLVSQIDSLKSSSSVSHVSIYVRDLNNGPWLGINENEDFSPASLAKVPILVAYLKLAQDDPDVLKQELVFQNNPLATSQKIQPKEQLIPNKKYSIQELITRMIDYSDNDAYFLLATNIKDKIMQIYYDFGIDISKSLENPSQDFISVKSYATFFRILFNSSYLSPKYSEFALSILANSDYKDGIVAAVPQNIIVAHKFGEREIKGTNQTQFHDCGIIYEPNHPLLVCIMSRGTDITSLQTAIRELSKTIYTYWHKRTQN